ncbi:hypothetical protein KR059_001549 [Drosophila kikkawai]|nr:hypothetical protein KR059_001549 [Drosophila kikkawai]
MAKLIILYIFLSLFVASGWSTYKFEIDIIRKLNAEHANSTSFVISPFSIHQALAMLYLEKESRRDYQLAKGLGITGKGSEQIISHFDEAYHKLIKEQFILANHIFYPEKFNVTQHMKKMSDELHVDVAKLKFSNAGNEITQWMQIAIQEVNSDLMSKTAITDKTKLIAVQGLFLEPKLKFRFLTYFEKAFPLNMPHLVETHYKIKMMYGQGPVSYIVTGHVDGVSIPFPKTNLKMKIFMPASGNNQEVLDNLNEYLGLKMHKYNKMNLLMPIFTVDKTLDLGKALESFGFKKVFAKNVDFKLNTTAPIFKQLSALRVKSHNLCKSI